MILKSIQTKLGKVNLLADFILSKFSIDELTIIQVIDCENFVVIKGISSSEFLIDISQVVEEFKETYKNYVGDWNLSNIIEIIDYQQKLEEENFLKMSFYNTENCSYNFSQIRNFTKDKNKSFDDFENSHEIEDKLITYSSFPHGYSLKMGRMLYYTFKHIIYNIPPTSPFTKLTLEVKNSVKELRIFDNFHNSYDDKLTSAILDCLDLNSNILENEIKKVDYCNESINPLEEYEFLKKINGELIII